MKVFEKFKEYIWLVNTIYEAKAITLAEINERWLQTEMSEGIPLSRTTFHRHRIAIEEIFGLYIDCDKKNGNKYYIGNDHVLREECQQHLRRKPESSPANPFREHSLWWRAAAVGYQGDEGES